MQIKIGSLHVEEGLFSENHTSYAADWRKYKQMAQDVPLFVILSGGYLIPMPKWVTAEWPIYVQEEEIVSELWGVTSTKKNDPHSSKKTMQTYLFFLNKMNFTPNPDFPEPDLLAKYHVEWAKKYTPTWNEARALSKKCR